MKILKFGAIWCSGCLVMKPIWAEIEKENTWIKTEYFDVDNNKQLAKDYKITAYPCFIFLNEEGNEIHREYGEVSKEKLMELINKFKNQ